MKVKWQKKDKDKKERSGEPTPQKRHGCSANGVTHSCQEKSYSKFF
jgi:hypothetical protein